MISNHNFSHGHNISRIGFGCWQMAGDYNLNGRPNGYGPLDIAEVTRAVHIGLENGINFFDTAIAYGFGRSEEELGRAIKTYPGSKNLLPFICTKFSMATDSSNGAVHDYSEDNLLKSVHGSLKRLQIDCLGAILLHNPPDDFNFAAYDVHPYERLVEEGKILSYGVSCKTMKGVENVVRSGFGSVIEAVYNPLDRRYEGYFADEQYKDKYLFVCRVPLASGFISPGTLTKNRVFNEKDIRSSFNEEQVLWVTEAVRKLSFLNDLEGGIAVSALRFQLSNANNTVAIPGIKNSQQVADAVLATKLGPLPVDVLSKIAEAVPDIFYKWK